MNAAAGAPTTLLLGGRVHSPTHRDATATTVRDGVVAWLGCDAGMYALRLGVDRAGRLNPFALLASAGVPLAFGSDAPVTGLDPWTTVPGAAASYAVWDAGQLRNHMVSAASDAVQRWSTDPRSRVPPLPRLDRPDRLPRCRQTVHRGAVIHG